MIKEEIKNSDKITEVVKMTVPDYVCNLICAGLVIEDLMDGGITEPPTEPPISNSPQTTNPHMSSEEGMHLNTFR